jgi:hypothetical protein
VLLVGVAFVLGTVLAWQRELLKTEFMVAILVAAGGWFVGVWYLFVSINAKTKLDLELKASDEMMAATKAYSSSISDLNVAVSYPPSASPPRPIPSHYWHDTALDHHIKLTELWVELLKTQTRFRESIEANEMALIELEDYYRYITLKHDELSKLFQDIGTGYINNLGTATSQATYDALIGKYAPMQQVLVDQVVLCLDFKKELLNKFQSKLFGRTLNPRKPLDGSKVLKELATHEVVDAMVRQRDAEFIDDSEEQASDR